MKKIILSSVILALSANVSAETSDKYNVDKDGSTLTIQSEQVNYGNLFGINIQITDGKAKSSLYYYDSMKCRVGKSHVRGIYVRNTKLTSQWKCTKNNIWEIFPLTKYGQDLINDSLFNRDELQFRVYGDRAKINMSNLQQIVYGNLPNFKQEELLTDIEVKYNIYEK